jgi:hypothetical protein
VGLGSAIGATLCYVVVDRPVPALVLAARRPWAASHHRRSVGGRRHEELKSHTNSFLVIFADLRVMFLRDDR